MPFFDDFATAVLSYPSVSMQLSIVDVNPPGTSINVNEVVTFQVRIRNNGHLNLSGVVLRVEGQNGVRVSRTLLPVIPGFQWGFASFDSLPLTVNAHSTQDTVNFYFRSTEVHPIGTQLIQVYIHDYNVNLNDILNNHTGHPIPNILGTYANQIFPA